MTRRVAVVVAGRDLYYHTAGYDITQQQTFFTKKRTCVFQFSPMVYFWDTACDRVCKDKNNPHVGAQEKILVCVSLGPGAKECWRPLSHSFNTSLSVVDSPSIYHEFLWCFSCKKKGILVFLAGEQAAGTLCFLKDDGSIQIGHSISVSVHHEMAGWLIIQDGNKCQHPHQRSRLEKQLPERRFHKHRIMTDHEIVIVPLAPAIGIPKLV